MLTGERPKENFTPPSKRVQVDIRIDEIVLRALDKTEKMPRDADGRVPAVIEMGFRPRD